MPIPLAASPLLHPAARRNHDYRVQRCLLFSLSDFRTESPHFMTPSSGLPAQRSRHSSSLPTGSMAESPTCCPLPNRLAGLLVASFLPHGSQSSSLSACPDFKCRPRASHVTSSPAPPTMIYFCQLPWLLYLLSADCHFSPGKSSHDTGFSQEGSYLPWLSESLYHLKVT